MKKILIAAAFILASVIANSQYRYYEPVLIYSKLYVRDSAKIPVITLDTIYFKGGSKIFGSATQLFLNIPNVNNYIFIEKAYNKALPIFTLPGYLHLVSAGTYEYLSGLEGLSNGIMFLPSDRDSIYCYLDGKFIALNKTGDGGGSGTVTSVASGNGMNFTTITGIGTVTMGTPSTLTLSTTNAVTSTSHTHALSIANVTTGAAGLAPASGGGTTNFLRADATWAAPPGGGTIGGSIASGQIAIGSGTNTIEGKDSLSWNAGKLKYICKNNNFIITSTTPTSLTGQYNTLIGASPGIEGTSANYNTYIGYNAGGFVSASTGDNNVSIGYYAGRALTTGNNSVHIGSSAGAATTIGQYDVFIGEAAGVFNTEGSSNTYIGVQSGYTGTTGGANTYLGYRAGYSNSTGTGNLMLGANAGYAETGSNMLYIENSNATKFNALIWGDFANDSLRLNACVIIKDTLEITKTIKYKSTLANNDDTCWMVLLPNSSGYGWDADTSETSWSASWATYLDSIGKFELFFATRDSLGELNWQRYKGDCYHKLNALTAFKQLQIAIEKNFAWDNEVRQRLDSLEMIVKENPPIKVTQFQIPPEFKAATYAVIIFFIGLLVVIIRQQIQINKLEKR